ncbi:MAG TPA: OmcA/MtrC family decaheme c-type cytochrome [Kofleriaceae bacterium]
MFAAFVVAAIAVTGCEGPTGPEGPPGQDGSNGSNGASCTLTDNGNGTSTITCPGGTSVTVPTGAKGTSCTVVANADGTRTITCNDGTSVVVTNAVVDYQVMTSDELKASAMVASIKSVTIPTTGPAAGHPLVTIKVTERHGLGVKGLVPVQPDPLHPNPLLPVSWRYALLKLDTGVNGSVDETWVSYMANNSTSTASAETAAAAGFTDNGDGTYTYKLAKDVTGGISAAGTTYEPDKPHRLVILMAGPGNPFSPINLVKDFVPTTGADITSSHEKFDGAACLECHTSFRAIADGTGAFGTGEFHSGGRYDTRTCVACHNDQRRFAKPIVDDAAIGADGTWTGNLAVVNGEATINFPVFIHKIHMGDKLALTGGTYSGIPQPYETTYPQDIRNCTKCHRNPAPNNPAPLAANWKVPSRRACGACHDDKSFVNPPPAGRTLHSGGAMANDNNCLLCHGPGGIGHAPDEIHAPVSPPNPNNIYLNPTSGNSNTNAAYVAAAGFVPPGAKQLTYEVSAVTLDGSRHPQIVFRVLKGDPNANPPVAPAPVTFQDHTAATEMIPGFVGSPSAYFVYAVPQDNITAPADFNVSVSGYLRSIWNGTATGNGAGTMTGPDANGFYTVTLTSDAIKVPTSAVMLTGGIGYTYSLGSATPPSGPPFSNNTQPFTEIDMPSKYPYTPNASGFAGKGGLIVPPPDVSKVADKPFTARRAIVDNSKCDTCHVSLGVGPDFHAGQRNDSATCAWCHRPNQTSSGWAANAKDFIHSIHAAEKRTVPFNWHAESPTEGFFNVTYPAILNRCEMCHLPGTFDFSLTSTTSALPNMLPSTVGQGRYDVKPTSNPSGFFAIAPPQYVTRNNSAFDYGFGFNTSNVNATLPDGISGTQGATSCTPEQPCLCTAANPCSATISGTYAVNNVQVSFTQKISGVTNPCNASTPCTCTTAQPCTGVVATCTPTTPCQAQPTTLVNSPIAAACVACHDSPSAVDHMQTNGASIWEPRSIALNKPQKEECLICHGPNRIAGIALVHTDKTP